MSNSILVVGASGTVGSELARLLKAEGRKVRAATGKPPANPDQVQLKLLTGEGIDGAFEGVERAFFLSPGGYADQYKILAPLIAKAKEAKLKKVVLMTAIGVDANPEAPLRRAEIDLEKSGVPYNIIRPQWFMQNFVNYWGHGIKAQGQIRLPVDGGQAAFIDTRDIAAVAAKLLVDDSRNGQAFTPTGPELLDHAQIAKLISEATGKKVEFVDVEPEELRKNLLAGGVGADYTELLLMLLGFLKAGYSAVKTDDVKTITGKDPRDFRSYAKEAAVNWK